MATEAATGQPLVVVGVDGSESSRRTLQFAAVDARRRGARLRVVAAYDTSDEVFLIVNGGSPAYEERQRRAMTRMVDQLVLETLGQSWSDLDVAIEVQPGPAGPALIERSADADLLVVGSHGHGGLRLVLLGSVSQQCAHHALCPVTIVRSSARSSIGPAAKSEGKGSHGR